MSFLRRTPSQTLALQHLLSLKAELVIKEKAKSDAAVRLGCHDYEVNMAQRSLHEALAMANVPHQEMARILADCYN